METSKPPLGVIPEYLWVETHRDPSLEELVARHKAVSDAVQRYKDAGLEVCQNWLHELGVWPPGGPAG